ncbi:MAG: hypothetical protein OdinLCB4_003260 [Candidatus Odinarchaeum yellowstonii]|uniref:Uncharacterized protein n=1 Tax=Odinarchaeota yellowstonii (strain LCB_4) TaxID=1841599 RepID=A0AAF0D3F2_ODILC|nr:MAG: hypothetical protein OdinLCB4_003260 [Candidatus Odinarchaeum yellowstonii]
MITSRRVELKKNRNLIIILILILITVNFTPLEPARSTPYQIYNYGVGVSPIPAELGMNISIIGGYTLKYNPGIEEGYAIFRLRNTTQTLSEIVYTEPTDYIERIVNFTLAPENWIPSSTGALAIAQLDLVIKTGGMVYTDNSSVYFYIQRAGPGCKIRSLTSVKEGYTTIIFELYNCHNPEYKVRNVLVNTQITVNSQIVAENISITDVNGLFAISFRHLENIKQYNITVLTGESQQYKPGLFNFTISVDSEPGRIVEHGAPYLLVVILTSGLIIGLLGYVGFKKTKRKADLIIR